MKLFKKNQIIIYVIVLMLMTAGYLNYTTDTKGQQSLETSIQIEANDDMQLADIGDATLVSSNDIVSTNDTIENVIVNNTTSQADRNIILSNEEINNDTLPTSSNSSSDYFVKSKLERDTMYSQTIETYENILNSSNSLETQKQLATEEIQKINEIKNSIMICENLIKTKGFDNNVVFVNGNSISVIIGIEELEQDQIAQIQNIIAREMTTEIENIHISTK